MTATSLYEMLLNAYEPWHSEYTLDAWITKRTKESKQFHFWCIVLELQLRVLTLVRSFREHSFDSYLSSLKSLAPWFFVLDRIHYKRMLPVHIKDMEELSMKHKEVYAAFQRGCFTGQKTEKRFSSMALDQIHEQENIKVKGVGGAVPILNKEKALLRWMVSGPEVATILSDFEPSFANKKADLHGLHHDEGVSIQLKFKTDVLKLTSYWSDRGNPFNKDNGHLINIHDRTVAPPEVYECISNLESLGKKQYQEFVRSVFITKEKSVWDKIPMTKPKLFGSSTKSKATAQPTALTILKKNSSMFMRLILNAQCRDADVGAFFSSEPFDYPSSLSVNGSLRFGCKSDVLKILFLHQKSSKEYFPPCIQARAFDAAATVQSLGLKESVKSFKDYKLYFWN